MLFASDRVRFNVVAIMVIIALMISGILTPTEAQAGFGDPVVILVAALFVVGESLLFAGLRESGLGVGGIPHTREENARPAW